MLPSAHYHGNIRLVDKPELVGEAITILSQEDIVGFDTETRPSFKKGQTHTVSLIQLASRKECFLFRLNKVGMPQPLLDFLQSPLHTKVGLSLHDDFHNLLRLCPDIKPQGFIDLQDFVKPWNITDTSLTKIHAILFGKRISKSQRLTNWEADSLTIHQQQYASLDALACIEIYDYLKSGQYYPLNSQYITYPSTEENKDENSESKS